MPLNKETQPNPQRKKKDFKSLSLFQWTKNKKSVNIETI